MKKLVRNSYDIIYIDGNHEAANVLADLVLSWDLLKVGGIQILDDYLLHGPLDPKRHFLEELRPQLAIDAFITAYRNPVLSGESYANGR